MARSKRLREQHRTTIVDSHGEQRAEIVVPIESLVWTSGREPTLQQMARWMSRVDADRPAELTPAAATVSVVFDAFAFTLFLTGHDDGIEFTGTHDGAPFADAMARDGHVDLFVTSGVDVRRGGAEQLTAAAASGAMVGARVDAFAVQTL